MTPSTLLLAMTQKEQAIDPTTTYVKRLEKEIAATERYLLDADRAITRLELELQLDNDEAERDHMEHVLALQHTYEKLPWIPDKNEVLDTAVASVQLRAMNHQQQQTIALLRRTTKDKKDEVDDLNQLLVEYTQLVPLLKAQETESKRIQHLLESQHHQLRITPESFMQHLGSSKTETQDTVKMLQRGLTRVLRKYIAVADYKSGTTKPMDQTELRNRMADANKLMRTLLAHVPSNSWVDIDRPNRTEESLITTWIINDIVIAHEDCIPSQHYRIRLRAYGV